MFLYYVYRPKMNGAHMAKMILKERLYNEIENLKQHQYSGVWQVLISNRLKNSTWVVEPVLEEWACVWYGQSELDTPPPARSLSHASGPDRIVHAEPHTHRTQIIPCPLIYATSCICLNSRSLVAYLFLFLEDWKFCVC